MRSDSENHRFQPVTKIAFDAPHEVPQQGRGCFGRETARNAVRRPRLWLSE